MSYNSKKLTIAETTGISSVKDLCDVIDISEKQLKYILYVRKNNYFNFKIKKKNGEDRLISAPTKELKIMQKKLKNFFEKNYDFNECQHGFVKKKNICTNANNHVDKKFVVNIDLKNFFPSINFGRVRGMFKGYPFGFNNEIATTLAKIACYNDCLPQGSPCSPIISNMICYSLDKDLCKYGNKNNMIYSRYADDLTFSSNAYKLPIKLERNEVRGFNILDRELTKIILKNGFVINEKKTKLFLNHVSQEVTGLVVNQKVNVKKSKIKEIRAFLYISKKHGVLKAGKNYCKKYGINLKSHTEVEQMMLNFLRGNLNFIKMVRGSEDRVFLKYADEYNKIVKDEIFDVDIIKPIEEYLRERVVVIESRDIISQGSGFFIDETGLITSTHIFYKSTDYKKMVKEKIFPISREKYDIDFYYFKTPKEEREILFDFEIFKQNLESDILEVVVKNPIKSLKPKYKYEVKIGEKVYLAGYAEFAGFKNTGVTVIEAKVISVDKTFQNIKMVEIDGTIKHGMSGGPVLNEKREVIGIIYAGGTATNGFILL